jgi:molybdopterin-guanine dinucleotide biosynthesis protein A
MPSGLPPFGTVILAGGRGRRLGGADKPGLRIGGRTLAGIAVSAAVAAGARQVVVVGPDRPELAPLAAGLPGGLTVLREEPPGSGPVPALRCGVAALRLPRAVVLAADLPFLQARQLRTLREAVDMRTSGPADSAAPQNSRVAGAVYVDADGRPQWLAGCWRTAVLRSALGSYSGASLHGVLEPLEPVLVSGDEADLLGGPWLDCDTPGDLERARRIVSGNRALQPGQVPEEKAGAEGSCPARLNGLQGAAPASAG